MEQEQYQPTASSGNQDWSKIGWAVVALAIVVIVAIAFGSGQDKQPVPSNSRPTLSPDARSAATKVSFFKTWSNSSEAKRDGLCFELKAYGKPAVAAAMQKGANGSNAIDWSMAADLLSVECSKR